MTGKLVALELVLQKAKKAEELSSGELAVVHKAIVESDGPVRLGIFAAMQWNVKNLFALYDSHPGVDDLMVEAARALEKEK